MPTSNVCSTPPPLISPPNLHPHTGAAEEVPEPTGSWGPACLLLRSCTRCSPGALPTQAPYPCACLPPCHLVIPRDLPSCGSHNLSALLFSLNCENKNTCSQYPLTEYFLRGSRLSKSVVTRTPPFAGRPVRICWRPPSIQSLAFIKHLQFRRHRAKHLTFFLSSVLTKISGLLIPIVPAMKQAAWGHTGRIQIQTQVQAGLLTAFLYYMSASQWACQPLPHPHHL